MSKTYFEDQTFDQPTEVAPGQYEQCTFTAGRLAGADLGDRLFIDCTFVDCDLTNAKLAETGLQNVTFERCKLLGLAFDDCRDFLFAVTFAGCNLELATFREWKLKGATFKECQLTEVDFTGADLREASFDDCDLNRATFERTDLRSADFRTAYAYRFSPEENRLKGAQFAVEGLAGLLLEYGIVIDG